MHIHPDNSPRDNFEKAYDQYADDIFRHCYYRTGDREKAMDIMQDSYIRTWEHVAKGKSIENVRAFLYRTATNLIIDDVRKNKRRKEQSLEELQEAGFDQSSDEDVAKSAATVFTTEQIHRVLEQLPEKYRTIIIMRYIDELQPAEIAEITGLSTNVVSVRINRGLKQLSSLIER